MNYKIIFLLILAVSITSIILFFSMDLYIQIYDPDWHGMLNPNQKSDESKKRIFIIGGSTVYSINAEYLNKKLSENEINYEVFNLADQADNPSQRLRSIENIIENKPSVVFYGLGYTNFEKFEKDNSNTILDFIYNPGEIFKNNFEIFLDESINEYIPVSPKDRSLVLLKYLLRGPDDHYHPFMSHKEGEIVDLAKIRDEKETRFVTSLETKKNDKEVIALNSIIKKLQEKNIKIILFSFPYSKIMLENTDSIELENFENILKDKEKEFDIPVFFLHEKYADMNIWKDRLHIANNPKSIIFTEDIFEKIVKVVGK